MIYLDFNDFINEKLGINNDVIVLSDFLYNILKNKNKKKIEITNGIPTVSFKINKIIINYFNNSSDIATFLDKKYSKLTKDGIIISLSFNKNIEIEKRDIYHELSHLIDHEKKLSLRIKNFRDNISASKLSNLFNEFDNLCNLLYLSDDGEIKSHVHEFYEILDENLKEMLKNGYSKNDIFKKTIIDTDIKKLYNSMINYNIFEDLKDISEETKIKFFEKFINFNKNMYKIKKYPKISKIFIIFYYLFSNIDDLNIDNIMKKTQQHINDNGILFRNKIHRLYGLL